MSEVVPSRFDEGTVYATFDGHRQNDFDTYIYASNDFGQTWRSIAANLKGEIARTLTEDLEEPGRALPRNRDRVVPVARSGQELAASEGQPADGEDRRNHAAPARQRHDPRDARAHDLDPRQPGAHPGVLGGADDDGSREAVCARPDRDVQASGAAIATTSSGATRRSSERTRRRRRSSRGTSRARPRASQLKIADAAGKEVREISGAVLANSNRAGIQSACWDLRVQPAPAPAFGGARPRSGRRRRPGRRSGRTSGRAGRCAGAESVRRGMRRCGRRRPRRVRRRGRRESRALTCCRGPTRCLWSSTARPSRASRSRVVAGSRGRADRSRTQEDVRHGDGDARAAAARRPRSPPAWDRSTRGSPSWRKKRAARRMCRPISRRRSRRCRKTSRRSRRR